VSTLSGGQQQRVLIARALATRPDLFVLDEPTAGVDADSQELLADLLSRRLRDGAAVLLVAHELGPLSAVVDRAVVLSQGRVVHDGPAPRTGDTSGEHVHGDAAMPGLWSAA
ncbi:MAG: ATP-binding cassette domain-containing protein, partial [Stackebrandtia sp.]